VTLNGVVAAAPDRHTRDHEAGKQGATPSQHSVK